MYTKIFFGIVVVLMLVGCQKHQPADSFPKVEYLGEDPGLKKPFCEAVRVGHILYLSGQLGIDPETKTLVQGGIAAETKQTMENIKKTLEKYGSSLDRVVKCTVMLADINEWGEMNKVYVTFFPNHRPARSAFGTSGLAMKARLEIECWATVK